MSLPARALSCLAAALLTCAGGCTEPRVLETGVSACSDRVDNDEDGRTDCADEDCALSGACEISLDACRDRVDQDHDGMTDCADDDCVQAGHCAPVASECLIGTASSCPEKMSCFASDEDDSRRQCARPGTTGDWLACARHTDCGGGRACTDGTCEWLCQVSYDCPSGALCVPRPGAYATCAPPCVPGAADDLCALGGACRSLTELGYVYDPALPLAACVLGRESLGRAQEGEPCDVVSPDQAEHCSAGLVCHSAEPTARCRSICAVEVRDRSQVVVGCASGYACMLQHMDVSTPPYGVLTRVTGLCLPPGPP